MPKTVFIDFDGTFAHHGQVPAGHLDAVREARANGHRVLLCTGRPKAMVPRRLLDSVFDGLVGAAGGYVEIEGTILADTRFPAALAARAVAVLAEHDATYVLEAPLELVGPAGVRERLRALLAAAFGDAAAASDAVDGILGPLRDDVAPGNASFGKVSVFRSPVPVEDLAAAIGPEVGSLPNSITGLDGHAGELYLRGVNKAIGVDLVAAHFGIPRADTIGIGDGHNDLEMLAAAGVAVAVEGAPPELLAIADLVIAPPAREGLVRGFAALGLTYAGGSPQA